MFLRVFCFPKSHINENGGSQMVGTKRRSQVTGHRLQVTERSIEELDTPLGFSCLFSFVSFPVSPQSGICLPSTMLSGFALRKKNI